MISPLDLATQKKIFGHSFFLTKKNTPKIKYKKQNYKYTK